jgi:hypothetical protein
VGCSFASDLYQARRATPTAAFGDAERIVDPAPPGRLEAK